MSTSKPAMPNLPADLGSTSNPSRKATRRSSMRDAEILRFTELLDATCSLRSRGTYKPNAQQAELFFRALSQYDMATVRAAFDAHVKDPVRGRFVPLPADIIAQIIGQTDADGRPGAEEAWATAVLARD